MIGATSVVALLFIGAALTRRQPGAVIGVLIMSMLLWPEFLRLPLGVAEMSVPRLVALAVFVKYVVTAAHRSPQWGMVDLLVTLIWIWTVLAAIIAGADSAHVTQMIGRGLDTVLIYFVARIAISSVEQVKAMFFWIAATAIFMCGAGLYEAITASSPYQSMVAHRTWNWFNKDAQFRYGLLRAKGSTSVSIYFGMAMMIIMGLLIALRAHIKRRTLHSCLVVAALLAALSSMSSGPWLACFMVIGLHFYSKRTHLIKPTIIALVFIALLLELLSNRHFFNLIDYLALDPQTAWYRTRLLEVAVSNIDDFWLVGVGSQWPHHWANELDGRGHIDVVNHFLIVALYGGLPALFMYVATHWLALKRAVAAWRVSPDLGVRRMLFSLCAVLVALDFSSMSVGLYGPPLLLSHVLLGVIISISTKTTEVEHANRRELDVRSDDRHEWNMA